MSHLKYSCYQKPVDYAEPVKEFDIPVSYYEVQLLLTERKVMNNLCRRSLLVTVDHCWFRVKEVTRVIDSLE